MNKIFLISDTHFGHKNIIEMTGRPFSSVEDMDEKLVNNWNSVVSKNDIVYHLGDVFWNDYVAYKVMPQLNGKITFIFGNHDKPLKKISKYFTEHTYVNGFLELKQPTRMVLCHYPLLSWNGACHGTWHFHGHTHNKPEGQSDRHRINVCVENIDYTPIELDEVVRCYII